MGFLFTLAAMNNTLKDLSMNYLNSANNQYGGTYVSPKDLPDSIDTFASQLKKSLQIWQTHKIKLVWIKIPNARAELLPLLYQSGFINHHCDVDFMMLTFRLEDGAVIPPFETHYWRWWARY